MKNVRKLTEGSILLAIYAVLLLLTIYVPFMVMILVWFLAVPFLLFAAKNDWKSILTFNIAALLLSVILGSIMSLPLTLVYGTTGSIMGYLIQKKKTRMAIFLSGSLVFLVNTLLIYVISIIFFNMDIVKEMVQTMQSSLEMSADLLKNFGNPEETEKLLEQYKKGLDLVITLIPTLFVSTSFLVVFIIQVVSFPIIKRFGVQVGHWQRLKEISLPKSLIYYFLITLLLSMFLNPEEGTYVYSAILNLTYILQMLMIFQGFTYIFFFLDQKGISKPISIFIGIMIFIVPIFLYIVGILGIIDLSFDLRRKFTKE